VATNGDGSVTHPWKGKGQKGNMTSAKLRSLQQVAKKSRMERTKNERIKKIMGVKGQPDIIEKKRL
jgi:hypothetical protein